MACNRGVWIVGEVLYHRISGHHLPLLRGDLSHSCQVRISYIPISPFFPQPSFLSSYPIFVANDWKTAYGTFISCQNGSTVAAA